MFLNDIPPCKNCKDRHIACHTTCERYKSWKVEHDKRIEEIKAREWATQQIIASKVEFTDRYWRKIHKKRK